MESRVEERSLHAVIFALFGGDAEVTGRILGAAGIESEVCASVDALTAAVVRGPGVLVLAEEALVPSSVTRLIRALEQQEPWSDLPIVVSAVEGGGAREGFGVLRALGEVGNVTLVERPVRVRAMVGAVTSALRARKRQYATRDLLRTLAASEANLTRVAAQEAEARAVAEALSREKDDFLATISHELRTPLNAMLGWARLLVAGRLDTATTGRALSAIERNAVAQAKLIEDLLDISRIISGKLVIDFEEVSLRKVIEAAIDTVMPALDAKHIELRVALDPRADTVTGDPTRLQQVVWNLLSNSAKFTPSGGHVGLRLALAKPSAELTVEDDGQGIEPGFLPHVFRRFHQEDGSITRRQGGLGLGLAICRQLIEHHGGTIEASSAGPGRGATFTVRVPLATSRERPAATSTTPEERFRARDAAKPLDGLRVLVVDDEADARELLVTLLLAAGARTLEASSAEDALALVRTERPNLIVSDVGMPGQDGYWFIRRVRALRSADGGFIPAIALTAYASAEDRRRAVDAGFELHMAKPVDPDELVAALATLARIAQEIG